MTHSIPLHEPDHHPCMQWETYLLLKERYQTVLDRARQYLSKKRRCKAGGTLSTRRKQALLDALAECPMCGEELRADGLNTEHIHSRSLGGLKSCDINRIAICVPCNHAKNRVMQHLLPKPKSKYQPSSWPMVEGYLLWSELTVDEGLESGEVIPIAQSKFIEARFGGDSSFQPRVRRALGRFSTWTPGEEESNPVVFVDNNNPAFLYSVAQQHNHGQ